MPAFAKPVVVVSRCLGFEACRYDGQILKARFVQDLRRHVEIKTVCPEVEIGLGTPRAPIRLVEDETRRLVQPSTGRDLTETMAEFSQEFLSGVNPVDGFILKSRSPSCGIRDATVHRGTRRNTVRRGPGQFAAAVLERFPEAAIEDEGRLTNARLRGHFLTKLYLMADFRRTRQQGAIGALVEFHTRHKHLLLAYNQTRLRRLGRWVANLERLPVSDVLAGYAADLALALKRPPRPAATTNVLHHGLGYVSDELKEAERRLFLETVERYRQGRLPLEAPVAMLQAWIVRFEVEYLQQQSFFRPYPEELVDLADSAKGRG